jgi:predicted Zn-dependent peptidase
MRTLLLPIAGALALASLVAPVQAQKTTKSKLDRTVQPSVPKPPTFKVPTWTRTRLSNGADLVVAEKHDLPLVAVSISFIGGSYNFEPHDRLGVASITAQMLSEGTTTKTGEQLSDAQQMLGTSIFSFVGSESGTIGFTALKDKLEPALALAVDMIVNPVFPADALERIRGRTLVQLTQAKDQPNTIAQNVFSKVLYGDVHPYGRVTNEKTVRAITRDDVVAFHQSYFRPGRAVITVSGDVKPEAVKAAVEKAMAPWKAGGERPAFDYPIAPAQRTKTIYLIDKPKSAQSVFSIGIPGPARDTPDYYAIQVMNHMLGGLFQSRLNHNIREVKGYSYGVSSGFNYGRGPGAFQAGGGIVTAKTDSALIEFMKELKGAQGDIPFTEDEIKQGKESLIQSLPRRFSSVNGIGGAVSSIYVQGLPETFFQDYEAKINAVTSEDITRVAKKYIDLDHLNIIIVGDRATIEAPLRQTGIAPITILDAEANAVSLTP